jgi:hypothetical protein
MSEDYSPELSPPAHVRIVDTAKRLDSKGKEYVAYRMRVVRESGEVNIIDQRYNFFSELHQALSNDKLVPSGCAKLPGKKWFFAMTDQDIEERRVGLQKFMAGLLASDGVRHSKHIEKFFDAPGRYDWPSKLSLAIDIQEHDPPHVSSAVETWQFHAHFSVEDRDYSVFACFHRMVSRVDEETRKPQYVYAVVSAFVDVDAGTYHASTILDPDAPATCDMQRLSIKLDGNKLEKVSAASHLVVWRG